MDRARPARMRAGGSRSLVAALALLGAALAPGAQAEVAVVQPETVGVSGPKLAALNAEMHALVDAGKLAGVTTLVARRGKIVSLDAYGKRDLESGDPLRADTIFRIASMTKPITGVAMMMLYEEGKWGLDDPVAKHIPAFAGLKVKGAGGALVEQSRPMTMRELMSHTAGFDVSAGYDGATRVVDPARPLQAMIDKLATLPLVDQPGTDWNYGPSVNIQGYIVERLSGQTLDAFFQDRIFGPLGMVDTAFHVPSAKIGRLARLHAYGPDGKVVVAPPVPTLAVDPTVKPVFLAGSGGLYSTAEDYWRFAKMLADDGMAGGRRLLKPETVKLMRANVLQPGVALDLYGPSQPGVGFGMDFAVTLDPAAANAPQGRDSYWWGGAFGTWFWIDPTNDLIVVGMIQNLRGSIPGAGTPDVRGLSAQLVYPALTAGSVTRLGGGGAE